MAEEKNYAEITPGFRELLLKRFDRQGLLEIIAEQNPYLIKEINRIEWVFKNKMRHLTWADGEQITERPITNEELALMVDEPFEMNRELTLMGLNEDQQRQAHIAKDPVLWSKHLLGVKPRAYQVLMLRHPADRKVLRAGRRLGKTYCMAILMLHHAYTTSYDNCIVVTPVKTQSEVLYKEIVKIIEKSEVVKSSIVRKVTSPQFQIELSNKSVIKFFTSGMSSGGKADVVRGQEANLIVLDELDRMHPDDIESIYAMLQRTGEDQADKILIGASTPTGQRTTPFYKWCQQPKSFKEFWFPSFCFAPGTLITMGNGELKNIKEVMVGDLVLTEKGPQKVLTKFVNPYKGELKNINIMGRGENMSIRTTPNHPFHEAFRPSLHSNRQKEYNWQWTKAENLTVKNWLHGIYDTTVTIQTIDMLTISDQLEEYIPGRVRLLHKTGRLPTNDFPRFIENTNIDLATLIGWYTAEGHVEAYNKNNVPGVVGWTLNKNEISYAKEIQNSLSNLNAGILNLNPRINQSTILYRVANAPLALLLQKLCGNYSQHKQFESFIMQAPLDFQHRILMQYGNGDGYNPDIITKPENYVFSTSSTVLANQLQFLTARQGMHIATISKGESLPVGKIDERYFDKTYMSSGQYQVEYNPYARSMLGRRFIDKGEYVALLSSIYSEDYEGLVYNLEVEKTNTYVANGILVHNCNPFFDKKMEEDMRLQYSEMGFRHEIEADWGEDTEGVYPRKYLDASIVHEPLVWDYKADITSTKSKFFIGVDWDKYGAGVNIVVLEMCDENYEVEEFRGKIKVAYREETEREEYTLIHAVDRIIELNKIFKPKFIYIDRGYGDVQNELLHKYGVDHPESGLRKKVKGFQFSQTIEMRDPETKEITKKEIKPFMVDNLKQFLEKDMIRFPDHDEELYVQLSSYIVDRITNVGRPVFMAGGEAVDHAHDALILACLAITQNYGELMRLNIARYGKVISGDAFQALFTTENSYEEGIVEQVWGSPGNAPVMQKRTLSVSMGRRSKSTRPMKRKMF